MSIGELWRRRAPVKQQNCLEHRRKSAYLRVRGIIECPVAFMFTGQAAQYVNMGQEIYRTEKRFRDSVDSCCEILKPHLGFDLRDTLS